MGKRSVKRSPRQMAEAVLKPLDQKVNRSSKDSVFCDLFKDPGYLLQFYAAIHPEDNITDIDDITLVTLDHKLLRAQYNDLGFIVGNRLMVLAEAQSTWTVNILIRLVMYLGETFQRYIKNNRLNVYSTRKLEIPRPELYVIYHRPQGDLPDEISLSKDYFGIEDPRDIYVDVRVKIIYDSSEGNIISQYINFCRVFDDQVRLYGRTEKAVMETIRICKDRNILREYLSKEEVPSIMFGGFDMEEQLEFMREEEREEGIRQGIKQGRRQGIKENQLSVVRALMSTTKWSAKKAMDALKIPQEDREGIRSQL